MGTPITLDELAAMVAHGFEGVEGRLNRVEQTLEQHTALHKDHSLRLDRIERKLDNAIERLDSHDVRIKALERRRGSRR